eukprot:8754429-Pyramimonas_sp.AAC.1
MVGGSNILVVLNMFMASASGQYSRSAFSTTFFGRHILSMLFSPTRFSCPAQGKLQRVASQLKQHYDTRRWRYTVIPGYR